MEGSDDVEVISCNLQTCLNIITFDLQVQKRLLEQIVIDKDLPVAMRTIQGAVSDALDNINHRNVKLPPSPGVQGNKYTP